MATIAVLPVLAVKDTVRKAQDKSVPGAGFILFRQCNSDVVEIALVKSKGKNGQKGRWGFPKGCSEMQDDNLIETAFRELSEEAGIGPEQFDSYIDRPAIEKKEKTCKLSLNVYDKINYYFSGMMKKKFNDTKLNPITPQELSDYGWYTITDAKNKLSIERYNMVNHALTQVGLEL